MTWRSPPLPAPGTNPVSPCDSNQGNAVLVSCPRSSLPCAANGGDQQATENKERVSRSGHLHRITNFGIGTLGGTAHPVSSYVETQPATASGQIPLEHDARTRGQCDPACDRFSGLRIERPRKGQLRLPTGSRTCLRIGCMFEDAGKLEVPSHRCAPFDGTFEHQSRPKNCYLGHNRTEIPGAVQGRPTSRWQRPRLPPPGLRPARRRRHAAPRPDSCHLARPPALV